MSKQKPFQAKPAGQPVGLQSTQLEPVPHGDRIQETLGVNRPQNPALLAIAAFQSALPEGSEIISMAPIISPKNMTPGQGVGGKLLGVVESPVPGVKNPLLELDVPSYGRVLFPVTSNVALAILPERDRKLPPPTAEEIRRALSKRIGRFLSIMYTGGVPSKIYTGKIVHCFSIAFLPEGWTPYAPTKPNSLSVSDDGSGPDFDEVSA